jgi:hypothetical protein
MSVKRLIKYIHDDFGRINKDLLHKLIALKQKLGTFFEIVLACLFMAFDGKISVPGDWVGRDGEIVFPKLKMLIESIL